MHNYKSDKPDSHKADVIKTLVALVLMFFSFTMCHRAMDLHWETRIQIGFLIPGVLYFLTVMGMVTKNGVKT